MEPIVNTEAPPTEITPAVVDQSVQNQPGNGTGAVAENPFERFKEFGVETPEALYEDYKVLRDYKEKVPTLEQKIEELSKADPFATPALKVVNDYQRALVANGINDPKEISRLSNEMLNHLQTNYSDLAAKDPAQIIEMKIRAEFSGIVGITDDEIAARVYEETFVDPDAYDMDDPAQAAAYKQKLARISTSAKVYAAQLEKDKQSLDFTPRVDPVAQAAAQKEHEEKQAKYQGLVQKIAGYQIPESINIGGRDIPITKTPELEAMLKGMESRPLDPVAQFLKMDGEIPDFDRAVQLAMIIHHLPQIVANYEAKATDAATRALEGGLQNSQHTGSGQGRNGGGGMAAEIAAANRIFGH